eukprot:9428701-Pyramimonas_sp.AAC.1
MAVYGEDWRSFRDSHSCLAGWMVNLDAFARCLCERWHLPPPLETMSAVRWAPQSVDVEFDIADTPPVVLPE